MASNFSLDDEDDKRRGSSLFASSGGNATSMTHDSSQGGNGRDSGGAALLVDFPGSDDEGGYDESDDEGGHPLGFKSKSDSGRAAPSQGKGANNAGYGSGAPPPGSYSGGRIPVSTSGIGSAPVMINSTAVAASVAPRLGPPPSNEPTRDARRHSFAMKPVAMGGL
eukprot:13651331-Ditylum_brightwellii.AAC.1